MKENVLTKKISCDTEGVCTLGLCVLRFLSQTVLFHVNQENLDRNTMSNSPKAPGTKLKIWERKRPSRGFLQKCAPHERSPSAPKFEEKSHEETLHQERCARKAVWDLANKSSQAQEFR